MLEEKPKKLIEKLKKLIEINKEKDTKRKIENLVVFIIILIITVILINTIWNDGKNKKVEPISEGKTLAQTETKIINSNEKQSLELEQRLENILQNIDGVGKVKVLLTYSESSQTMAMYNEDTTQSDTEETDNRRR